jgi:hypothetical protein
MPIQNHDDGICKLPSGEAEIREMRIAMKAGPRRAGHGQIGYWVPSRWMKQNHEAALVIALICHRKLFGEVYLGLQPDYFWQMPHGSGVLCCPLVTTSDVAPYAIRPGDIDLLIVPYEHDELILDRIVACEVKVIRATFANQGKSPNDFGGSQASALVELGFPYAALIHLVVSDASPKSAWRRVWAGRMAENDLFIPMGKRLKDQLPGDLIRRAYGRLVANADDELGLAAVYVDRRSRMESNITDRTAMWFPRCRKATSNCQPNLELMRSVGAYFHANSKRFLETPRYDP